MKLKSALAIGLSLSLVSSMVSSQFAYAKTGDIGFFGGISQGTRLPKTTEILLAQTSSAAKPKPVPIPYKEEIFINGEPVAVDGFLTATVGTPTANKPVGTYKETYQVVPDITKGTANTLNRNLTFNVNYRVVDNQTIKDYEVATWAETITLNKLVYTLNSSLSKFSISIIEDKTPGVTYYKGNISEHAVYVPTTEPTSTITIDTSGPFYGENNAWSSTEAQRLDATVTTKDWQMTYQIRPSVSVNKTSNYSKNEPQAISFAGNYQEIMQNTSGLAYTIFTKPQQFFSTPSEGNINIPSLNTFEQLLAPDTSYLKGNPAEGDINKLFAMQVLTGDPKFFQPTQAITREQFITALVKAIKLPVAPTPANKTANKTTQQIVFPDVPPTMKTYPYIMAAFKAGLAVGRSDGKYYSAYPIQRQEAITILMRALGLENLGLDTTPSTQFSDDKQIANWAKREIYAAKRIDIIGQDEDGNIRPLANLSNAEAAALINRMIDYMRSDLATDYSEHIVNYAN